MPPISPALFERALSAPPKIVGVMLPSAGLQAYVRQVPAGERGDLMPTADDHREPLAHRGRVLSACLCYHDGSQDFDEAAVEHILKAQPGELAGLYTAACHLNGMKPLKQAA